MKTNILKKSLLIASLGLTAWSCTEGDKMDYNETVVYMSGAEVDPIVKFVVEDTPASQIVSVASSNALDADTKFTLAIDPSKVDEYNKQNGTSYYSIPEGAAVLENGEVTIAKGKAYSSAANVRLVSTEAFQEGRLYLIPVTIQQSGVKKLESSSTIYLKVSRVFSFTALATDNSSLYSNFIFDDSQMKTLGAFTYEIKCYSTRWHRIARLCSFTAKDESNSSMLRFGENGFPIESLQWISPGGSIVSSTLFSTERWYTISLVYDGNALTMYVDGEKDAEGSYSGTVDFQRFELGMSWENYPWQQQFYGRIAEVRVWERALSPGEIKLGICGVDTQSDGLLAYWKMNEGEGHIFHDATGNGYDMDWSKTVRDTRGDGNLVATPNAADAVVWVADDKNKCAE